MSKSNRAESSCGRKADNTLLQLPNDVIGIAKNRLSSISSKFRAPAEIPQKAPDNLKQRSRVSTLSYFRKPKSKSKSEGPESPNINGEYKETSHNGSKPKFKRQISIDIAPSRPVSMISSSHRRNSVEHVESPNSFPGTSTQRFGFFNHHHDTSSKAHVEEGRKPAIESICLFPRLVFPVHSSAITNSSMSANLNSDSLERPRKKLSFREPEIVETKKSPAVSLRKAKLDMFAALSDVSEDKSDGVASIQSLPVSGDDELESQAMRIVRTVGQAFEVCHKLSPDAHAEAASSSAACDISEQAALSISDKISEISDRPPLKKEAAVPPKSYDKSHGELDDGHQMHLLTLEPPPKAAHAQANRLQRPTHLDVDVSLATNRINQQAQAQAQTQVLSREPTPGYTDRSIMTTPQATEHREKFLEQSLEQQRQQTRAATAQLAMLNDQLVVEKAARVEAQARTHQLLLHNKELIDHISMLVAHLQERERGGAGSLPYSLSGHQLTNLPQAQSLRDVLEKQNQAEVRAPRLLHSPANLVLDNRGLLDSMSSLLVPRSPHSPRDPAYENNNNSSLASAATDSPGGFPGPYNFTYSLHQPEPIPSPMARRYNNMTTLTSAAAYLDQQNANDLTDFLIDLVNQQSPNGPHLPQNQHLQQQSVNSQLQQQQAVNSQLQQQAVNSQLQQQAVNSQLQQQALNRLNLYSGQSSPLQQRHPIGASSDHLFASANQQSPNMPRQLSADMRHSHSFLNTSAIQQEPLMSPREEDECQFIRPLSQIGTITTLDEEGRVRIVVPTKKSPQPIITRTTSERVPNKNNVLMAQVRDQWGRHTTK